MFSCICPTGTGVRSDGAPLVGFGRTVKNDLPPGACGFGIRVKHRAAVASPRPLAAKALPEVPHGALLGVETRP